jgi:hypothetical protein
LHIEAFYNGELLNVFGELGSTPTERKIIPLFSSLKSGFYPPAKEHGDGDAVAIRNNASHKDCWRVCVLK